MLCFLRHQKGVSPGASHYELRLKFFSFSRSFFASRINLKRKHLQQNTPTNQASEKTEDMMSSEASICSAVMHRGGASRMMLPFPRRDDTPER